MIIHIDTLVRLLMESSLPQLDVPPDDRLIINYEGEERLSDHRVIYDRIDTGFLNVDVDKCGNVTSIELDNMPLKSDYRFGRGGAHQWDLNMIIHIDTLVRLLMESSLPQLDVPPDERLIINFGGEDRISDHSDTYDRIDTGCLNVDVDGCGNVTSIELENLPLKRDYRFKSGGTDET